MFIDVHLMLSAATLGRRYDFGWGEISAKFLSGTIRPDKKRTWYCDHGLLNFVKRVPSLAERGLRTLEAWQELDDRLHQAGTCLHYLQDCLDRTKKISQGRREFLRQVQHCVAVLRFQRAFMDGNPVLTPGRLVRVFRTMSGKTKAITLPIFNGKTLKPEGTGVVRTEMEFSRKFLTPRHAEIARGVQEAELTEKQLASVRKKQKELEGQLQNGGSFVRLLRSHTRKIACVDANVGDPTFYPTFGEDDIQTRARTLAAWVLQDFHLIDTFSNHVLGRAMSTSGGFA